MDGCFLSLTPLGACWNAPSCILGANWCPGVLRVTGAATLQVNLSNGVSGFRYFRPAAWQIGMGVGCLFWLTNTLRCVLECLIFHFGS